MPIGYYGYVQVGGTTLLTNSGGLNRQVNPLFSQSVQGLGWLNGAGITHYADPVQHFEGGIEVGFQPGLGGFWTILRDWAIYNRILAKTMLSSPNGITKHDYTLDGGDARTGVWLRGMNFNFDPQSLVAVSLDCVAIKRTETTESGGAGTYAGRNTGIVTHASGYGNSGGTNTNPLPGWKAGLALTINSLPGNTPYVAPNYTPGQLVVQSGSLNYTNNTQLVYGCTGEPMIVAVIQGTQGATGNVSAWIEGTFPDPYAQVTAFSAIGSSLVITLGSRTFTMSNVVVHGEGFVIQGQNQLVPRSFQFTATGDTTNPILQLSS